MQIDMPFLCLFPLFCTPCVTPLSITTTPSSLFLPIVPIFTPNNSIDVMSQSESTFITTANIVKAVENFIIIKFICNKISVEVLFCLRPLDL